MRSVRLTKASQILKIHASLVQGDKLFTLRSEAVEHVLKALAKKAGIKKRVYPTLFRHMDITENSRFLTEAEQRVVYGWSKNSKMPGHYNHLSGRDIDEIVIPLRFRRCNLNLSPIGN